LEAIDGLPAGTRLPTEPELMEQMSVGRSAVREALSGLALLGVVEIRQGQGVFATGRASAVAAQEEIGAAFKNGVTRDLLEVRMAVEVEVARRAAERRTDKDLKTLERLIAEEEKAISDGGDPSKPGAQFHLALADASHNEVLTGIVRSFFRLMTERVPTIYTLDGFPTWEIEQHKGLVEAIEASDEKLAAERMGAHVAAMARHYSRSGTP
jgi:GntR family transcriptional repressor for pyruvate dehydrogenase complex